MKLTKRKAKRLRSCTLYNAIENMKEANCWMENKAKQLKLGESVEVTISITNCGCWYGYSDTWKAEECEK